MEWKKKPAKTDWSGNGVPLIPKIEVTYGFHAGRLFFIPKLRVIELLKILTALRAKTWKEFKQRIPKALFRIMTEMKTDYDESWPDDDQPFNVEEVPCRNVSASLRGWGYDIEEMVQWMPEGVKNRFGRVTVTVHDGCFLELDHEKSRGIIAMLNKCGYRCKKDSNVISSLVGDYAPDNDPKTPNFLAQK